MDRDMARPGSLGLYSLAHTRLGPTAFPYSFINLATMPPACSILSCSSGRSGLWSIDRGMAVSLSVCCARTARLSPTLAVMIKSPRYSTSTHVVPEKRIRLFIERLIYSLAAANPSVIAFFHLTTSSLEGGFTGWIFSCRGIQLKMCIGRISTSIRDTWCPFGPWPSHTITNV